MVELRHIGHDNWLECISLSVTQAVHALLTLLAEMPCGQAAYVYAQWHPENTASAQLFAGCGFTVVQADEEVLARRKL